MHFFAALQDYQISKSVSCANSLPLLIHHSQHQSFETFLSMENNEYCDKNLELNDSENVFNFEVFKDNLNILTSKDSVIIILILLILK